MEINSLVVGGQYRIKVTPASTQDVAFDLVGANGYTMNQVDSSGTGGVETLDISPSSSGPYYVLVYSQSGGGSVQVELLDIGPPTVSINSPTDNYNTSASTVTISWSSSDLETSITEHEIYVNGSLYADNIPGGTTSYDVDFTSEGTYEVKVVAYDEGGNSAWDSIIINVDWTAPTVAISSPTDGSYINSTDVMVTWSGFDGFTGIEYYEILDNGVSVVTLDASFSSYTLTGLSEGIHTIRVVAYDYAGNSDYDEITITVDVTDPTVSITDPSDGAIIESTEVTVNWTGSDNFGIDHYEVKLNDSSWIDVGLSTSYTFTDLEQGDYIVYVKAIDKAGNIVITSISFSIYIEIEIINPTSDPETGEAYVSQSSIVICWENVSNVNYYEVIIDSGTPIYAGKALNYEITGLSEGDHNITVVAHMLSGATRTGQITLVVDLSPPSVAPDQTLMYADAATTSLTITWSGSDSVSGIDHYEIYVNGLWQYVGNITSYIIDTSSMSDGVYPIFIRAFDKVGHWKQTITILVVDKTAPQVQIEHPADGAVISTTQLTVIWNASDETSGIDHFEVSMDGISWINIGTRMSYTFTLVEGTNTIYIRAYDSIGNYAETSVTVTVDTTPPTANITSPTEGEVLGASDVTVTWTGSDSNGIDHYIIRLDDGAWINVGTLTTYTFTGVPNGVHIVYVVAYDVAGNTYMAYVIFEVSVKATPSSAQIIVEAPIEENVENKVDGQREEVIVEKVSTDVKPVKVTVTTIRPIIVHVKQTYRNIAERSAPYCPNINNKSEFKEFVIAIPTPTNSKDNKTIINKEKNGVASPIIKQLFLMYSLYLIRPPN